MPIYAYECTACSHQFDRLQRLSDPDPIDCPACAQASLRRQVTAPAFRLAGAGWYETDFKKDGDRKRNLADGGDAKADAKPADSPASSTDAKPAAKAEAAPAAKAADSGASASKPAPGPAS